MPVLREAIAEHQHRWYGLDVDPDTEVLVTAGATEALAASLLALTEPGDEILAFEPFYDAYAAIAALAGARLVTVPLRAPGFQPDHEELRQAVNARTRIILVNSPHNPTGSVFPRETLELIVELANRHNATIVTDEVYEHLTFDVPHIPIATLPGAAERTVTISSGGKTFNTTGWKIGWTVAPPPILQAITAVKQYLTYVSGAPFQPAIAAGLGLPDSYFEAAAASLAHKRDVLSDGLATAGFEVFRPASGYFVIGRVSGAVADDLARGLAHDVGVVAIPVNAFVLPERHEHSAGMLRFAFCKRIDVLEEAVTRLARR